MAAPSQGVLGESLDFTVRSYAATGAPVDADSLPTYTIYENNIDDAMLTGTMAKFDDANTTGLYSASINITTANGFELYKNYTIDIITTVSGVTVTKTYSFVVGGYEDVIASSAVDLGDLRAVADFRGSFVQGKIADLLLKITSFDGTPLDPIWIQCTITPSEDPSGNTVSTGTPFQAASGYYVYEWDIDDAQTVGKYTVTWDYIIENITRYEKQYVYVVEEIDNPLYFSNRVMAFREALSKHLICAQSIPVYSEQAKTSRDRKTFYFSFPRWNQSAGVKIYRNKKIVNTAVEVNYFNGSITFDDALLEQDIINADYNFKWFSEEDLDRFLYNAVYAFSMFPPAQNFIPDNIPNMYIPAVLYGATKDALRQLMMCLQLQEPQLVFGGPEKAQQVFANLDSLKQNYEKDWDKFVDNKKFGPYPRSYNIVTPEYTLPGGRSLIAETKIITIDITDGYIKGSNGLYIQKEIDMEQLYIQWINGNKNIGILSQDDKTGKIIYAPISQVWVSGIKDVYELKTNNGYDIRSSHEHLFYINKKYIPLQDIKIGDEIITSDNNNLETTKVKSIKKLKRKEKMYDLEVVTTANLFANGIKCHNSRWFRYLFST